MFWLRTLLSMFYAPGRALGEVRDRAPLGQALLLAWLAQTLYSAYTLWPVLAADGQVFGAFGLVSVLMRAGRLLLFNAVVLVPILVFVANIFERRGGFGLMLRQEYAATAATVFYARAVATLVALPLLILSRRSDFERGILKQSEQWVRSQAERQSIPAEEVAAQLSPTLLLENLATTIMLPFLVLWLVVAVRETFRLTWPRALAVVAASALILFPVSVVVWPLFSLFSGLLSSPFILLLLFFGLRGYFAEFARTQRSRASFRRNLEAATLNPADASAHYNLGLIHLQRKELAEARQRFERAIEIDAEELDAHFQLGRIARAEGRLSDAIRHFGEVVARDKAHAQHEVWREIGATYVSAGQYGDALDALGNFTAERQSDPEGLYLTGRAYFGLGNLREAREWMQRCIEAVKTAPAYKYRTEKRWLNEAQQFLRSLA